MTSTDCQGGRCFSLAPFSRLPSLAISTVVGGLRPAQRHKEQEDCQHHRRNAQKHDAAHDCQHQRPGDCGLGGCCAVSSPAATNACTTQAVELASLACRIGEAAVCILQGVQIRQPADHGGGGDRFSGGNQHLDRQRRRVGVAAPTCLFLHSQQLEMTSNTSQAVEVWPDNNRLLHLSLIPLHKGE